MDQTQAPREPSWPLTIAFVACEASGDALGASLIRALRRKSARELRLVGLGGERMAAEGLESLFPLAELAVMGFVEVIPSLPRILRRQRQLARAIAAASPDAVVTIDSSSLNKGLARLLQRTQLAAPRIHYVAPMVWAWRPGRVHGMARRFDHLMALFRFEPPLFEAAGLPTTWVGHPAVEVPRGDGEAFRRRHDLGPAVPILCLLPGSRPAEVAALLPRFRAAARLLREQIPDLHLVIPAVGTVAPEIARQVRGDPRTLVVTGEREKRDAFAVSNAALAASGTVTLELALAEVPMVVAYRPHPISGWLAARLIRIPQVALVNILAGRAVVPELLRGACEPPRLVDAVLPLLLDVAARQQQLAGFEAVRAALGEPSVPPSERAAAVVLALASGASPAQIAEGSIMGEME